ncbi:MAG: D-glycero-beta-D-manno-heptose 1-phosphate adenylyltransferase [Desulfarculus sp.]|nr:D-glycero-beta-D-manno-heptose 1-phosphate adenylyltransferase [Desulfarculus sp.]
MTSTPPAPRWANAPGCSNRPAPAESRWSPWPGPLDGGRDRRRDRPLEFDARQKIVTLPEAARAAWRARAAGGRVVFTNGCFDLLHAGHVRYLGQARALGDLLILGLNSDSSVRGLEKGHDRPLVPQEERAEVVAGLMAVDLVVIFEEPTPLKLIETIAPDVLVKGGDWPPQTIVGHQFVSARGGRVLSIPLVPGLSTTNLAQRIRHKSGG